MSHLRFSTFSRIIAYLSLVLVCLSPQATAETNLLKSQNIRQILIGQTPGFRFGGRNVPKQKALRMVMHEGRPAAEITMSVSMKGHKDDWYSRGQEGYAQRFEFGQHSKSGQRIGRETWTHMLLWLPNGTVSREHTWLFDFKDNRRGQTFGQLVGLGLSDDGGGTALKLTHRFEDYDCIVGSERNGTSNSYCDWTDTNILLGPLRRFTGRWVQVVVRAVWDDGQRGAFDFWIDGKKVVGYRGDTSKKASNIPFKFGVYRIKLNRYRNPKDVRAYFSAVGTAPTCKKLGLSNCEVYESTIGKLGYFNAQRVFRHRSNEKSDFIARGGRVIKQ
ncbi:heparin lyase I family protein [Shimia aestuarii]|uniref:Polysaccharide lyase n=1 Tax=Shimia aestuarii TaxID=254406 RepID=A0A1I4MWT7_9RHOB|nr:heparin lyase I family protein [Shimia aestuarii]SFM07782.1 Polysaccharide lyase [Shimia aestuarii]